MAAPLQAAQLVVIRVAMRQQTGHIVLILYFTHQVNIFNCSTLGKVRCVMAPEGAKDHRPGAHLPLLGR